MTLISKTKSIFLTASLLYSLSLSGILAAEPAHSALCPTEVGHIHSDTTNKNSSSTNTEFEKRADAECSSCHGANGIAVSGNIPNLAGQECAYMCGWLAGCREQGDKCEGHEDLATKWTDQDLAGFSTYYSRLPSRKW